MMPHHFHMAKDSAAQLPATPWFQKMAQASDYFYSLDSVNKKRYSDKISSIKSEDPYAIKKNEFIKDVTCLPTLWYPAIS